MVVGFADSGVCSRFLDIRGLVDDHGSVTCADTVSGLAGTVSRSYHRRATSGHGEIADRHEFLGQRDAGLFDALDEIFGRTLLFEGGPQDSRSFKSCAL